MSKDKPQLDKYENLEAELIKEFPKLGEALEQAKAEKTETGQPVTNPQGPAAPKP